MPLEQPLFTFFCGRGGGVVGGESPAASSGTGTRSGTPIKLGVGPHNGSYAVAWRVASELANLK